jgi:hypothetical protein
MRRRRYLASVGLIGTGLAGCSSLSGWGGSGAGNPADERTHGGHFVLHTATHNDWAGEYLVDAIARDGTVVESFEDGVGAIEVRHLDETQGYGVSGTRAKAGSRALRYEFGAQSTRAADNSQGTLHRPMAVVGANRLSVWTLEVSQPQDDIHVGWGFQGDGHDFALGFDLHRETTGEVHVRTNLDGQTDVPLGVTNRPVWRQYAFTGIDWETGECTARIRTDDGEELARRAVSFVPPG